MKAPDKGREEPRERDGEQQINCHSAAHEQALGWCSTCLPMQRHEAQI